MIQKSRETSVISIIIEMWTCFILRYKYTCQLPIKTLNGKGICQFPITINSESQCKSVLPVMVTYKQCILYYITYSK
jgi:hypothetical protein